MSDPGSNTGHEPPQYRTILNVYTILWLSLIIAFVPTIAAAGVSALLFLAGMIAAYVVRARAEKTSLTADHMTYLIRTIWIGSLLMLLTIAAALFYLMAHVDFMPVQQCMAQMVNMDTGAVTLDPAIAQRCTEDLLRGSRPILITAAVIAAAPPALYFIYRFGKGLSRAVKGYRIGTPFKG
jgi:uncharacterized membrane protein